MVEKNVPYGPAGAGIRIMDDREVRAIAREFSRITGLDFDESDEDNQQFAVNRYCFPPIPRPQYREVGDYVRNPPTNINQVALGHPVFYLPDDMTKRQDGESWEAWSIRMFFTIDAAGYWDSHANFIDFLEVKEYNFDPIDIEAFHSNASMESEIDRLGRIEESTFSFPLEQVQNIYMAAMDKCNSLVVYETAAFEKSLRAKMDAGLRVVGGEKALMDPDISPTENGSFWSDGIGRRLDEIVIEFASRKANEDKIDREAREAMAAGKEWKRPVNNYPVSELHEPLKKIVNDCGQIIYTLYGIASVINVPVQAGLPEGAGTVERLSAIETRLRIGMDRDNLRAVVFDMAEELYSKTLSTGDASELAEFLVDEYSKAWFIMRLALVNFRMVFDKKRMPFQTYPSMRSWLVSQEEDDSYDENILEGVDDW